MDADHETWHVLLVVGMALITVGLLVDGHVPWYVEYALLLGSVGCSLAAVYRSQTQTASVSE